MVTIATQLDRIQRLLQDENAQAYTRPQLLIQHQEELSRLALQRLFGDIVWMQGVANQALYILPASTAHIEYVCYNNTALRFVTEETFDRKQTAWEDLSGEPQYWTTDGQAPNTLRLVPQPVRTGSSVPAVPPVPFLQSPIDNLLVFLLFDPAAQANDETDQFPLPDVWEDALVYRTGATTAQWETFFQQLPLAAACRQLSTLWLRPLGGE